MISPACHSGNWTPVSTQGSVDGAGSTRGTLLTSRTRFWLRRSAKRIAVPPTERPRMCSRPSARVPGSSAEGRWCSPTSRAEAEAEPRAEVEPRAELDAEA